MAQEPRQSLWRVRIELDVFVRAADEHEAKELACDLANDVRTELADVEEIDDVTVNEDSVREEPE